LQVTATGSVSEVFVNSDVSTSAVASRIALGNNVGTARFTLGLLGGGGETAFLGTEGNFPIYFQTNGTERARIDSSGNVGIGTSLPSYQLDVKGAQGIAAQRAIDTDRMILQWDRIIGYGNSAGAYNNIIFQQTNNSGSAERMRIDGSGYVGIGTTSPGSVCHVNGSNGNGLTVSGGGATGVFRSSAAGTELGSTSGDNTVFLSGSGTEKARIDSSGRLLVGTSSANANGGVLQLSGGITFPGTAVAATDVNTLDDYEEGTFTPTIQGASTPSGQTYDWQKGRYTKVGNIVTCEYNVKLTVQGTTDGGSGFYIGGFPFNASADQENTTDYIIGMSPVYFENLSSNLYVMLLRMSGSQNIGNLYGQAALDASMESLARTTYISGTCELAGTVTYRVA
jgi:hypothetical protein